VDLERGPLSLASTIEKLLERKSSGSCLKIRKYGRVDPLRWPRNILYSQKLALTSSTSDGLSVGIVSSRAKAAEFVCFVLFCLFSVYRLLVDVRNNDNSPVNIIDI
jgi:hypothetical protein